VLEWQQQPPMKLMECAGVVVLGTGWFVWKVVGWLVAWNLWQKDPSKSADIPVALAGKGSWALPVVLYIFAGCC